MALNNGDVVEVNVSPDCEQQFMCHGIPPYVNGLTGHVGDVEVKGHGDHMVFVWLWEIKRHIPELEMAVTNYNAKPYKGWFKPSELKAIRSKP